MITKLSLSIWATDPSPEHVLRVASNMLRALRAIAAHQAKPRPARIPWCIEIDHATDRVVVRFGVAGNEGLEC